MKLTLADKSISYKTLPSTEGKTIMLALAITGTAENKPVPLQITLEKGLKAQNTTCITNKVLKRTTSLPSPLHLEVSDIKTGFEIENPGITEPRDMPWIKNAAIPTYYDIRDDRIHFFTTADEIKKIVLLSSKNCFKRNMHGQACGCYVSGRIQKSYSGGRKLSRFILTAPAQWTRWFSQWT